MDTPITNTQAPIENTPAENTDISTTNTSKAQSEPLKKISLDINGEIVEIDASEFEDMRKKTQLYKSSTSKFQEAAKMEKYADEILSLFKPGNFSEKSFKELAKRTNLSRDELLKGVEYLLEEEIKNSEMTPHEKEIAELKREKAERLEQEKLEKMKLEKQQHAIEVGKHRQQRLKELNEIQNKTSINLMEPAIFAAVNNTYQRLEGKVSLSECVKIVEEKYKDYLDNAEESNVHLRTILKSRLKGWDDDDIDAILNGPDAFRARQINKVKDKAASPYTTQKKSVNQEKPATPQLSAAEYYKNIKRKKF